MDPAEREMYAQDAYSSVTLLSLLFLLWGGISLLTLPNHVFDVPNILQVIAGGTALVYFLRTRHRPSTGMAVAFSMIVIGYSLIFLPWTAMVWCRLGRPMEAFTVPEIGMIVIPLVIPRYAWLGAFVLGLFQADGLFAYFYARQTLPAALIPITEPLAVLIYAVFGMALLLFREGRRQLTRRHILLQAEITALRNIGPRFVAVRNELATQLEALAHERQQLGSDRALPLIDRALDRLSAVGRKLDRLVEWEPTPAATIHDQDRTTPSALGDGERLLLTRDAHLGATVFATVTSTAILLSILFLRPYLRGLDLVRWAAMGALSLVLLVYLMSTRRHPSDRRNVQVLSALVLACLAGATANQWMFLRIGRPFQPFLNFKLLMVLMGLVVARRLWISVALLIGTGIVTLVLFFSLGLGTHRDLISFAEPWVTLVVMGIGLAAAVMRDQRRLASLRLLRAESEMSALFRRAHMFLALRDQLNSPIQTLVVCAGQLDSVRPPPELDRVHAGIDRLVALSGQLADLEYSIPKGVGGALDAERELHLRT